MDNMTVKEMKVVEELRRRTINEVTPKMLKDVSLFYRFAKAREFNIADAETMLRKHISWRKEMDIDTILTDYKPPEVLVKYVPTNFVCFDKEGCIVRHNDCGRADQRGIFSAATKAEWGKFFAHIVEQDIERVINRGGNLGKPMYSGIEDFENFTYGNAMDLKSLPYIFYILKMFLDNYPETIRTITVINAPPSFEWVYATVKPILPPRVIQKVRIYGTDGWKEVLSKEIDAHDLPAYLGGKRTDPNGNPLCETFIKRGQLVPKSYYMQNRIKSLVLESDVEKVTVMPFSKEEITFVMKEENSYLEWEFETKNRDIDFSLVFRGESPEKFETELIPKRRIDTSYKPVRGCFRCEKLGNYAIVFDNSHSWLHSKEVYYKVGITNANNKDVHKST